MVNGIVVTFKGVRVRVRVCSGTQPTQSRQRELDKTFI